MTKLTTYQRFLQWTLLRVRPNILADRLKSLLRVKRVAYETKQGTFWLDPVSIHGMVISKEGIYEREMITTLEHYLKPGSIFVDLGANEGYFTIIGARLCGPNGRVIAVEPQNRLIPVIEENVKLNASPNVTLLNVAVGDKHGTERMTLTASTNNGSSGFGRRTNYRLPTQEVSVRTLEQVLDAQQLHHVDFMKVDIEGYEYEALLGSMRVFEQGRLKRLALEIHHTILQGRGKDGADIERMLEQCGYQRDCEFNNSIWTAPVS